MIQPIRKLVQSALQEALPADVTPSVTHPAEETHGDYATNAAFILARRSMSESGTVKKEKRAAAVIAREIAEKIPRDNFEKIEVTQNGFINFFLKKEILYRELAAILKQKTEYGKGIPKKEKINVEFISANPTGPITLGNGRGAFLGDALVRILKHAGATVESDFYVNDAKIGGQVQNLGKAIRGEKKAYPYIEEWYLKTNPDLKKELKGLSLEEAGYRLAQVIHKKNEETLKKIGISIDTFFHEQSLYDDGKIEEMKKVISEKKLDYQKEEALWLRTSRFGDDKDKVLIRSTGAPTYLLADLAYHWDKFMRRKFDIVINILGADHHGTIQSFRAALKAIGIEENRFKAIITQTVRFIEGGKERKMSKRKGEFVTFENLIEEIGTDAARFFFLEKSPNTHMDFDIGLAKEQSAKNPVYYIQYAYARISSILRQNQNNNPPAGGQMTNKFLIANFQHLKEHEELTLIKKLAEFPEIIEDTAHDYQVHRLTRYTLDLARMFHNFYEKYRVISDDKELTKARLALIEGIYIIIGNSLDVLGISKPEKM